MSAPAHVTIVMTNILYVVIVNSFYNLNFYNFQLINPSTLNHTMTNLDSSTRFWI